MHSYIKFQIKDLRAQNLQKVMEVTMVLLAALFTTVLLPSLLVRYVYSQAQLLEQPVLLELIPLLTFVVGIAYLIYVIAGNFRRGREIKALQLRMAEFGGFADDAANEMIDQSELDELEKIVEKAMSEVERTEKKSRPAKKSAVKKPAKKSTKKTAAKKKTAKKSK